MPGLRLAEGARRCLLLGQRVDPCERIANNDQEEVFIVVRQVRGCVLLAERVEALDVLFIGLSMRWNASSW